MDTYENKNIHDHNVIEILLYNDKIHIISLYSCGGQLGNNYSVLGKLHAISLVSKDRDLVEEAKINSINHPGRLTIGNDKTSSDTPSSVIIHLECQPVLLVTLQI